MTTQGAGLKAQLSWALYDWAASPLPTVVITFIFAAYFERAVAPDTITGSQLWAWTITASGLAVAVFSPILGAIGDAAGPKKPWLAGFTIIGVISAVLLWHVEPHPSSIPLALILVGLAYVSVEFATVFYNAMLPGIVTPSYRGRLSGWAWGLGYAGGLACLVVALVVFVQPETPPFGLDASSQENVRITGPLVGLWLLIFALPLFLFVPDRYTDYAPGLSLIPAALSSLKRSLIQLWQGPVLGRFLLARMLYTDGLNTLFAFGGLYAAGTFDMDFEQILLFGIVLNITAGIGAFLFGWIDDRIGAKATIMVSLAGLTAMSLWALLATDATEFWIAGSLLGIFVGPTQAASRSLMSDLVTPEDTNRLFGLYAFSGRATAFLGPLLVGLFTGWFDSQRAGMATILGFFLVGGMLLIKVPVVPRR